jgi:HlyD family type I secretion membrane fusion protein
MKDDAEEPGNAVAVRHDAKPPMDWKARRELRRRIDAVGEAVGAFESETAEVLVRTAPVRQHTMLYVFLGMIFSAIALSAFAKIDRVVTGIGRIVSLTPELYLSTFDNAIVRAVLVKPGERVKKGQPLATLDPTFAQADLSQLLDHRESDEAQIGRDEAELVRKPYKYSPAKHFQVLQKQLYDKRQAAYTASIAEYDGKIHSAEALVAQYLSDTKEYAARLKLAQDIENSYIPLVDKGYVSQLQLTQATDARTEMQRLLADAKQQLESNRELLAAVIGQKQAYIEQLNSEIAGDLVTMRKDLDTTVENIDKAKRMLELTSLDSPVDAVVVKIGKLSPGSIAPGGGTSAVTPGTDPLFTLMPVDAELVAQMDVQSMDAGFIRVGDPVTIKLDDYNYTLHGTAKGKIQTISNNSFTLDDNGQPASPYFRVLVKVTELNFYNVPNDVRLMPGETLTADVLVGHHTLLEYVTEGGLRTGAEAMREP